jgi:hypothetical protein
MTYEQDTGTEIRLFLPKILMVHSEIIGRR